MSPKLPGKSLTGQASPGRLVCAPVRRGVFIVSQTAKREEDNSMRIGIRRVVAILAAIALVAAPVAAVWALVGLDLGRRQDRLAAENRSAE